MDQFCENKSSQHKKRKTGGNKESRFNQKLKPEHSSLKEMYFQGICRAITQCHKSKTNSEARFDHKCVSSFAASVVKALDPEDSAENKEQTKVSEAQNNGDYTTNLPPIQNEQGFDKMIKVTTCNLKEKFRNLS